MFSNQKEKIEQRFKGRKDVFPGQLDSEEVIFFSRKHPLSFAGMVLIAFAMLVLPVIGIFIYGTTKISLSGFAAQIFAAIIGAYTLFVLGFFLVAWISYYYDVIIVTDCRVVEINQEALFFRKISEANLADIEDVNAEIKGILPTFFHYGTVFIQTAGTAENFEFQFLPRPYKIAKLISDLHEQTVEEAETREAKEIGEVIAKRTPKEQKVSQKEIKPEQEESAVIPPKFKDIEAGLRREKDSSVSHDDLKRGGETDF
jgi:hypothetical protein